MGEEKTPSTGKVEMEQQVRIHKVTIDATNIVVEIVVPIGSGPDEANLVKDDHPSVVVITAMIIPMLIQRLLLIPTVRHPYHHHHRRHPHLHHRIRKIVPERTTVAPTGQ
jgi:hypothetical protein